MNRTIDFHPKAAGELSAAVQWYEAEAPGLGARFLAAVDACVQRIVRAPQACARWHPSSPFRRAMVARFPFLLVFIAAGPSVTVVAEAHTRRRPGYWRGRG